MVMTRRTVIDFQDLRFLAITSHECGTKLVLDVSRADIDIPKSCSSCGCELGSLNHNVGSFIRAYSGVKASRHAVQFEIDRELPES